MKRIKLQISNWLALQPQWVFAVFATLAALSTYSCMYAFRKPFTVGFFHGEGFLGVDLKIWIITFQVIGYTLSKFLGIKYVSELEKSNRANYIVGLLLISEIALLFFWLLPAPYNVVCMLFNGLPLGMIWGVVFSYLEGRKLTELLGAGLSVSFILASGFVKTVGEWVMISFGVSEFAMPFITGLIFILPLVVSVFLLDCLPEPTAEDEKLRTKRTAMNSAERKKFLNEFFFGIVFLVFTYIILTVFRDLRDNFSAEIWSGLGHSGNPAIFTLTEIPVAFFTLLILALITFIKSNYKAFNSILLIVSIGLFLIFVAGILYNWQWISGEVWMVLLGVGLYLGYIPFNAFLYERLISSFKYVSNIGFVMYVSDAFGYLGSTIVIFFKNFVSADVIWLDFIKDSSIIVSAIGIVAIFLAHQFFKNKYNSNFKLLNNEN